MVASTSPNLPQCFHRTGNQNGHHIPSNNYHMLFCHSSFQRARSRRKTCKHLSKNHIRRSGTPPLRHSRRFERKSTYWSSGMGQRLRSKTLRCRCLGIYLNSSSNGETLARREMIVRHSQSLVPLVVTLAGNHYSLLQLQMSETK